MSVLKVGQVLPEKGVSEVLWGPPVLSLVCRHPITTVEVPPETRSGGPPCVPVTGSSE